MRGAAQEVACTASRRTGPRRWLRAVAWLIAAGLHGRANATTQKVAEDLALRMDYDTGHGRYCMLETAHRLGVDKATVKRHIAVLRELGALAWVQHGTRANIRRALGMGGYAATATVYAAVIPPMYDHAMGHTVVGSGYTARIVIDQRGQDRPVDNPPVDNPSSEACAPPSLTWVEEEGKLKVESGCNYTPQAGRERFIPHQASSKNGHRRTAGDVERAMRTIRLVRALVNWTQRVPLRRLEFVLRPWTDRGWDAQRIAAELIGMVGRWKPAKPAEFIQSVLAEETAQQARRAVQEAEEAAATAPNAAFAAAAAVVRGQEPDGEVLPDVEEVPLSDGEIQELRDLGRRHPRLVVDYAVMAGEAAAVALYGRMLYDNAHRLAGATA